MKSLLLFYAVASSQVIVESDDLQQKFSEILFIAKICKFEPHHDTVFDFFIYKTDWVFYIHT